MFEKEHIQRLSWYCISLSQFHISSLQDKASLSVVQYVHSNVKRNAKLKRNNRRTASSKYSHTKNLFHLFYSCNSNPERVQRYPGRVQMFWQRIHKSCTLTKYHTWIIRKILKTQDHLQKDLVFTLKIHLSWMSVLRDPETIKPISIVQMTNQKHFQLTAKTLRFNQKAKPAKIHQTLQKWLLF